MQNETDSIVRLKCESCGAEVVVNTISSLQGKCPWCRNVLSINTAQKNGTVPDGILPFKVTKEEAIEIMKGYLLDKKNFASSKFKKEVNLEEIKGVYFPYFLVDINADVEFEGIAEKNLTSDNQETPKQFKGYHDIERFLIKKRYQITVKNHILESKSTQLKYAWEESTNNIMNAILPFDIENAVTFEANYLRDFMAIQRDLNNEILSEKLEEDMKTINLNSVAELLRDYDRGFKTKKNQVSIRGTRWKTLYCPIWLYSYSHLYKGKTQIVYIAVNARTKKIMGSIPMSSFALYKEMWHNSKSSRHILPSFFSYYEEVIQKPIEIVKEYTNYTEKYKMEEKKGTISNIESEEEKIGIYSVNDYYMSDAEYYSKKEFEKHE